MSAPLRIVLLGSTGFVGQAVLRRAASTPGIEVRALVRRIEQAQKGDFVGSLEALPKGLFFAEPHVVLHFATKQVDRDGTGYECNVENARRLLAHLPESTRGIVYGSSASVYGQGEQLCASEQERAAPETALAVSRLASERVLLEFAQARHVSAFALRPRMVVGRGDVHTLPGLSRLFARRLSVGSGEQRLTVIDVDDYAEVALRLARAALAGPAKQRVLNVGYREPVRFRELCELFGSAPRIAIPVSRPWLSLARRFSPAPLAGLFTRLELFGLSHHLDVSALAEVVGPDLVQRDPREALSAARAQLV